MKNIAIKYGTFFFGGLLLVFLFSHYIGISDRYNLRMVNALVHSIALYYAVKQLRIRQPETLHNYVSGVAQGMYTGVFGSLLFAVFMILFLAFSPQFLEALQISTNLGTALTPITAGVFILMEGIGVSLIGSYLLTRYVDMRLERKAGSRAYAS